jgi:hypothetical protein
VRLRLLVGLSDGRQPGDSYEPVDAAEAGRMIASRFAVPWAETEIETAVAPPAPETRQSPATRRKKG